MNPNPLKGTRSGFLVCAAPLPTSPPFPFSPSLPEFIHRVHRRYRESIIPLLFFFLSVFPCFDHTLTFLFCNFLPVRTSSLLSGSISFLRPRLPHHLHLLHGPSLFAIPKKQNTSFSNYYIYTWTRTTLLRYSFTSFEPLPLSAAPGQAHACVCTHGCQSVERVSAL